MPLNSVLYVANHLTLYIQQVSLSLSLSLSGTLDFGSSPSKDPKEVVGKAENVGDYHYVDPDAQYIVRLLYPTPLHVPSNHKMRFRENQISSETYVMWNDAIVLITVNQ
jgi:hypothetical protein